MNSAGLVAAMSSPERKMKSSDMPTKRLEPVSGFMPEADKFLWLDQFNWSDFGDLIVSLYRRNGYSVETVEADGMGVPCALVVCKGGKRTLLQCQPWATGQVGVQAV